MSYLWGGSKYKLLDQLNDELIELSVLLAEWSRMLWWIIAITILGWNFQWIANPVLKRKCFSYSRRIYKNKFWASARTNANLLVEIADSLSPVQWAYILEAFCKNDQIYGSYYCPDVFCSLFKNSCKTPVVSALLVIFPRKAQQVQ